MSIYIYEIHHSLQQTNTSVIISNNQAQSDTISCLSTLIFDCLAQALTGIQIFSLNIRQQLIVSSSSTVTKSSNISSQVSLNNSIIYIHTIKTITGCDVLLHFIYCFAEFLVILSHDILHSKQVIQGQSRLDIYSIQLTLFDVVSSVELRTIDPFVVAFGTLFKNFFRISNCQSTNRWLINIYMIFQGLVQNLTKYSKGFFASHLFVCEGIHLDENDLVLVLLIEQFIPLPYISILRLAELIVYDPIEIMLILD
ncbi:unnamed protein product [Rotaria sp. Silwood1]|nr:unnamed protein product [Rotaria sp. Silwood1]CAF4930318.1 unnamed protein product [Rotaria sp. Silwood1]